MLFFLLSLGFLRWLDHLRCSIVIVFLHIERPSYAIHVNAKKKNRHSFVRLMILCNSM